MTDTLSGIEALKEVYKEFASVGDYHLTANLPMSPGISCMSPVKKKFAGDNEYWLKLQVPVPDPLVSVRNEIILTVFTPTAKAGKADHVHFMLQAIEHVSGVQELNFTAGINMGPLQGAPNNFNQPWGRLFESMVNCLHRFYR